MTTYYSGESVPEWARPLIEGDPLVTDLSLEVEAQPESLAELKEQFNELQYAGLTPVERALAESDLHMSTCDEPSIDDCGDCQRTLARFRKLIDVVRPVIEEQLAEKYERELLKEIGERDRCAGWADRLADAIATYAGVDIGEHSNMNDPWENALEALEPTDYDAPDAPLVAAASIPTPIPDGEE